MKGNVSKELLKMGSIFHRVDVKFMECQAGGVKMAPGELSSRESMEAREKIMKEDGEKRKGNWEVHDPANRGEVAGARPQ